MKKLQFKIWVGSLKDHNEGRLVGEWLTLPMDEEELNKIMDKLTYGGEHDYQIMDSDAPFEINPHANVWKLNEQVQTLLELVENLHEDEITALLYYADDLEDLIRIIEEEPAFIHLDILYPTWSDLAEYLVEECGYLDVPEHLRDYIDYERIGLDLKYSGFWYLCNNGVAINHC